MDIVKKNGINWKERRLIRRVYQDQKIVVRLGNKVTKKMKIGKGVRQGCCMPPRVLNMYSEEIINNCLHGRRGVTVKEGG